MRETTTRRLAQSPVLRSERVRALSRRLTRAHETHTSRLLRFALVGGSGTAVNYVILFGLVELGHLPRLLAAALATEAAIVNNFAWNSIWTFRDAESEHAVLMRAARYNVFALGGLLISVGVLGVLVYLFGIYYLVANLFAIAAATLWNYIANTRWTWTLARE